MRSIHVPLDYRNPIVGEIPGQLELNTGIIDGDVLRQDQRICDHPSPANCESQLPSDAVRHGSVELLPGSTSRYRDGRIFPDGLGIQLSAASRSQSLDSLEETPDAAYDRSRRTRGQPYLAQLANSVSA